MKSKLTFLVLFLSIAFSLSAQSESNKREIEEAHYDSLLICIRSKSGQFDSFKQYVANHNIDLNYYNNTYGLGYLFAEFALIENQTDIYNYLMEVDDSYKDIYPDVLIAALKNNFDDVISLIHEGAYINQSTPSGLTPLMFAVLHHNKEAVVKLIDLGADVNYIGKGEAAALPVAMYIMDEDIAKLLISKGADINQRLDSVSPTMLFQMVDMGKTDQVRFILELGADIDELDNLNYTPLMQAIRNQDLAMVKLLLQFDPDLYTKRNRYGDTALMMAVSKYNNDKDILAAFLDAGADVNTLDSEGRSLLIRAVYYANTDIISLLIDAGINVNVVDKDGQTALSVAQVQGYKDIARLLRAAGAK